MPLPAGRRASDHRPSTLYAWSDTYTFRYTPLGALLFVPLVPLSAGCGRVGVGRHQARGAGRDRGWYARPWSGVDRWLVLLAVVAFPPIVHDLVLGNVSTITVLVLLALARWPDARGGVALGLLLALMPKPHLIPVLVYLAFRQRRAFAASVATIAVAVLAGVAFFGIEPWVAFAETLREPLERTFTANIGFSALLGPSGSSWASWWPERSSFSARRLAALGATASASLRASSPARTRSSTTSRGRSWRRSPSSAPDHGDSRRSRACSW